MNSFLTTPFLTLDALVLPPPLPAIVSLFLVAGFAGWAEWIFGQADAVRRSGAFVVVVAICGVIVHALAMAHLSSVFVLRVVAAVVALGALHVWPVVRSFRWHWIAIVIGFLALAALGPVTDADSLDYHLGVPLDWLRHGGVVFEPHWLHARVIGLGEAVNMLGLAAGTDGLGALLQVSGIVILAVVLGSLGKTPRDRTLGMLLALPPAILPLATAQKPQLLPLAALIVATVLARRGRDFALVFGCVGFAMASKFSFFVAGTVVMVAAVYWAEKKRAALMWAAIALMVLLLPVLWRNFFLYGDPLSPFLESLRAAPNSEVLRFADYLRDAGEAHTLDGVLRFLAELLVPHGFGDTQTILGLGVFCVLLTGATEWTWIAVVGGLSVLLFTIWRGQMAPRYLLEVYVWFAMVVVTRPWSKLKSILLYGLAIQTAGVAAMAVTAAFLLFPGALTAGLRERVMMQSTYGYAEAKWIDRIVPKNATIMVETRAYALLPRPFLIPECAACGPAAMMELFRGEHVNFLILNSPYAGDGRGCVLTPVVPPEHFFYATRNPLNKRDYWAVMNKVNCN